MCSSRRFEVGENEGSFFAEFFIYDKLANKYYSLNNKVPPKIQRLFAQELKDTGKARPHEIRVLIEFVLHRPFRKTKRGIND